MSSAVERALNRTVGDTPEPESQSSSLLPKKPKVSNKQLREMKYCFEIYEDILEPGRMYQSEFITAVRTLGFNASKKELDALYALTDLDGSGYIDLEEWTSAVTSLIYDRNTYLQKQLNDILAALDQEDRGQPKDRLQRIADGMGDDISEDEIKDIVNGKGILSMTFDSGDLYSKLFEVTQPLALRRAGLGEPQKK